MPLTPALRERLAALLGTPLLEDHALSGGDIAEVRAARCADGRRLVIKLGAKGADLASEGAQLGRLAAAGVPVPKVWLAEDAVLVMAQVEAGEALAGPAQEDLARVLAALHAQPQPFFGFECATAVGGLVQPNPQGPRWIAFFAEHRLLAMAAQGVAAGRLPIALAKRVETLAGRLERWLIEPPHPSLIHGDLWGGNVLCRGGKVAALIDPAPSYSHPVELAFGTLFSTLDDVFFDHYQRFLPIEPGFFEERRVLYTLYPLLVHVRLFGGGYGSQVDRLLSRFGL
ncbi:fructosamine kinase family protein [Rhodospirillum rubrum]|uniref:Aminoglycoside phosphotransferase n=3 Tax=Rhodospirillum rubrum TaxID=1085 RepID=Q2RN53_RHORT|nr:fructosamine kinase family protein [Rhodospirillum rubrum]ABC24442.1 Aminoglycoside phosphotransferase [Rhodospirillum rubrum ATCC 11170]AEO50193.1 aminoglycoside phosphotransferase [Rhodospirillum rubrum F11]MBK5956162.1 aminoglycoside phosphotransferase [Rhodospirillum rubrum]QXG80364.1 fructosamine kinase family protein [Rhodospirillum rubrum]